MSNVPSDEITAAYDDWAQTYETMENATRDLAASALRRQGLNLQNRLRHGRQHEISGATQPQHSRARFLRRNVVTGAG